jgi:serine O-acetyltransferase
MTQMSKPQDAWFALKADTFRLYGESSTKFLLLGVLTKRTFRAVVSMRLCQLCASSRGIPSAILPILRILHRWTTSRAGIDLPWSASVGPGLAITHGWGCVVAAEAEIGRNVTLFHGATVGRRDRIGDGGKRIVEYPVIEDDVWIGPHAIVVGRVRIGRGSRIGGGAYVTSDVAPHSIVIGNPARVVKLNCVADVVNPWP